MLQSDVDLETQPITTAEKRFVTELIHHLAAVRVALKSGTLGELQGLERDIVGFFGKPIPARIWTDLRGFQNDDFVLYVESIMASKSPATSNRG